MAKTTKVPETKANVAKNASVAAATKAVGAAKKTETIPVAKAEEKKPEAKPAAKVEKKPAAKKATKKTTTKRAAKKPVEKIQEVFIEHNNNNYQVEEIVEKIHEVYKAEGHRVGAIKSLRVYIQPENNKAYYVINGKEEGKFVEF